jgi:two-component system NtrC family sensor kinase
LETAVVDLVERLPNLGEMLRRSLRGDIEIKISAPDHPCRVRIDPAELELALLNLGVNARDSMPNGGTLSVSLKTIGLSGQTETDGLQGNFVAIEVSDSGCGIAAEILPRVFEPFFTTKGVGKGTGLGLSQVYGFAKQSGGTAAVRSTLSRGTTVTLYLPESGEIVDMQRREPPDEPLASSQGSGVVLLVEDNADVAAISSAYFQEMGYGIDLARNGSEALEKLQTSPHYVLVFSDILMPGSVGGLELARIVREHHPTIPVLLTTGYSESVQEARREGYPIVQKPYNLQDLSRALHHLFSRSGNILPLIVPTAKQN